MQWLQKCSDLAFILKWKSDQKFENFSKTIWQIVRQQPNSDWHLKSSWIMTNLFLQKNQEKITSFLTFRVKRGIFFQRFLRFCACNSFSRNNFCLRTIRFFFMSVGIEMCLNRIQNASNALPDEVSLLNIG